MTVKSRIQAFTLLEITIAMLLVAVIAGFAYYALNTFVRLSQNQQLKKREKYVTELFLHRLNTDWNQAATISYEENILSMQDCIGTISYTFADSLVLRNQYELRTDSFFLNITILDTETVKKDKYDTRLLYRLQARVFENQENIPIVLQKNYSASQILHYTIDTNNYVTN